MTSVVNSSAPDGLDERRFIELPLGRVGAWGVFVDFHIILFRHNAGRAVGEHLYWGLSERGSLNLILPAVIDCAIAIG